MTSQEAKRQLELAKGNLDVAGVADNASIKQAYATLGLARAVTGLLQFALDLDEAEQGDK